MSEDPLPSQNLAVLTIMSVTIDSHNKKSQGYVVINPQSHEVLHYLENADYEVSNLTNCGIYIFSTRFYHDFGQSPFPESSDIQSLTGYTDGLVTPTKDKLVDFHKILAASQS